MKTGLYGGSFSPVHNGHVNNALDFYDECGLDRLYIVPSFLPPHKAAITEVTPADRLNMLIGSFYEAKGKRNIIVSDYEIRRMAKSYTYYTLKYFKSLYPDDDFFFLCGTDMLLTLESWYRFEDLFAMCRFAHNIRRIEPHVKEKVEAQKRHLKEAYGVGIVDLHMPPIDVSSTEIRERLAQRQDISHLVPPAACRFIRERTLYGFSEKE